ncbi:MAG: Holliday junction branch migration DNA helicase RuvB [Planctomycetota bacterium]|nr:MAG: Holliday junction branch migration DNA helicase RuvB [Planctomycetota bacterium]
MKSGDDWTKSEAGPGEEPEFDRALRPKRLEDFVGQQQLRQNLEIAIRAAQQRQEPLDHILFCGPPGLGKTTLAFLIAREMGTQVVVSSGPSLASPKDLVGTLTRLATGDVFFLDEIHRVPRTVEEFLYSAMEDQAIDITIDQGPAARSIRLPLAAFTLVGATTREGLLAAPFRNRFGITERLQPYPENDLIAIVERASRLYGYGTSPEAAALIAARSRGVPRVALRLFRRLRDFAQVAGLEQLSYESAGQGLAALGVDELGLEGLDREILNVLCQRGGQAVGLKTLAACVGESEDTIEAVHEPHLLRLGLLSRTPRGRVPTGRAFAHLGLPLAPGCLLENEDGSIQTQLDFES